MGAEEALKYGIVDQVMKNRTAEPEQGDPDRPEEQRR
jgi:hypothetical protein